MAHDAFYYSYRGDRAGLAAALETTDVNVTNIVGECLLHDAAGKMGSVEMATDLIRRGINVNHQNHRGTTSLTYAVIWCKKDVAEVILHAGGRPDIADEHGNEPLWYAVGDSHRDYDMIQLLVQHGADPLHRNKYGKTPMDIARDRGLERALRILDPKLGQDSK
jgi:ankyrin repeat protein